MALDDLAEIAVVVLLLLDLENIRRPLEPREQIGAVVSLEKRLQRLDARDETDEIIFMAEREHSIDHVVPRPLLAQRDLSGDRARNLIGIVLAETLRFVKGRCIHRPIIARTSELFGPYFEPIGATVRNYRRLYIKS